MELCTVYFNPSDFPGLYVVRKFRVEGLDKVFVDAEPLGTAETLQEVRKLIPPTFFKIGRNPNDDPVIVEVWI